jgi:hypothetical protein
VADGGSGAGAGDERSDGPGVMADGRILNRISA